MNSTTAVRIAAIYGFAAVALGAFGAHGLKATLEANGTGEIWQTGASYHLVHSVALLLVSWRDPVPVWAWRLFALGMLIFSGTLYLLAVTNIKWLGAITPIGGLCLLGGWLALVFTAGRERS